MMTLLLELNDTLMYMDIQMSVSKQLFAVTYFCRRYTWKNPGEFVGRSILASSLSVGKDNLNGLSTFITIALCLYLLIFNLVFMFSIILAVKIARNHFGNHLTLPQGSK